MITESWPTQVRRRWVVHLTVLTVFAVSSCCCILPHTMPRWVWQREEDGGAGKQALGFMQWRWTQARGPRAPYLEVRILRALTGSWGNSAANTHIHLGYQAQWPVLSLALVQRKYLHQNVEKHGTSLSLSPILIEVLLVIGPDRKSLLASNPGISLEAFVYYPSGQTIWGNHSWLRHALQRYQPYGTPLPDHRSLVLLDLSAHLEGPRKYPNFNQGYPIGSAVMLPEESLVHCKCVCGQGVYGNRCFCVIWWELPAASWRCSSPTQALHSPRSAGNSCWPSFAWWIFPDKGGEVSENSVILLMNSKFWKQ